MTEKIAKIYYSIIAKKLRPKNEIEVQYKKIKQAILDHKFERVEVGLRYLRTSRIMLCHDYCSDVTDQVYMDTIKMELFNEVN